MQWSKMMNILLNVLVYLLLNIIGASSDSFYFTRSPQNQDVEEGQPFRLECAVKPNQDIHYSWLHNGTVIKPEFDSGRRYLEGESNLQILHADRDNDPGRYQCQALNKTSKFSSASKEVNINVYWMDPEVEVVLQIPSRFEEIRFGKEVQLGCNVKSNPPVTLNNIVWFHNGNMRLPNMQTLNNGSLYLASFGMQHVGNFHCRVIHAAGKMDSRPPFVLQADSSEPPNIDKSLNMSNFLIYAILGRPVKLICPRPTDSEDVDNDMPMITVWGFMTKLGEQQQSISSLPGVQLLNQDFTLAIDRFEHIHANFYTCEVSIPGSGDQNLYIFQVYTAELYSPKPTDFSPRPKKNLPLSIRLHETLVLRYYADLIPSISYSLENISNPPPKIEWFRVTQGRQKPTKINSLSSTEVHANRRVFVMNGRNLVIQDAIESDSGSFELVLTNLAGRVSVPFQIMVFFPPEFNSKMDLSLQTFDEDESVVLSCHIRRRAILGSRIYWEKDGRPLVNYGNDIILEEDGERLRFSRLTIDHQGLYQCFVFTDGYPNNFPGQLQELEIRGKLQFVRKFDEHFLEINMPGKVNCKVRGHGKLSVNWFRKSDPTSFTYEPIKPPNQVENGVLIFQYVQKQDAGSYICIAQSTYRNSNINMTVNIIVGEKPRILDISTNQTIREGGRIILNCRASGDPQPQISWIVKKSNSKYPVVYTSELSGRNISNMLDNIFESDNRNYNDEVARNQLAQSLNPNPTDVRLRVFPNGSLIINQAMLIDNAEYICIAGNKHAIQTRQGVHVNVLTTDAFLKLRLGDEHMSPSMVKTIVIVVNCAIAYLGLIFGLAVGLSIYLLKHRKNRRQNGKSNSTRQAAGVPLNQENSCVHLLNEKQLGNNTGSQIISCSTSKSNGSDSAIMTNHNPLSYAGV